MSYTSIRNMIKNLCILCLHLLLMEIGKGVYEAAPLCGASEAPECIRVLHNQLHPHITSGDMNSLCSIIDPALLEADACVNRSLVFCSMETKIGIWASTDPHMREYRRQYADQCHQDDATCGPDDLEDIEYEIEECFYDLEDEEQPCRAIEEARLCSLAHAVLCHITNISLQRKVQEAESLYNCGTNTTTESATQATEVTSQVTEVTSQVPEVTTEVTASTTESEAATTRLSYSIKSDHISATTLVAHGTDNNVLATSLNKRNNRSDMSAGNAENVYSKLLPPGSRFNESHPVTAETLIINKSSVNSRVTSFYYVLLSIIFSFLLTVM